MSNYTYMVTNNINGKVYVGSHCWDGEGIDPNYYGSGTAITAAVRKYGKDNFQVEPLYYYDTVEECRQDEERILTEYNVRDCPHSYNLKNSAIGMTSEDMTEEVRKKISQVHKGKTVSEDTKRKISKAMTGKNKGKTVSEEAKRKMSQAHKGKTVTFSEDTKRKLSQSKNYKKTPIVAIQKDTGKIRVFESLMECARQLNLNLGNIYKCLKGRRKTCKGYIIKCLEQLESGIYEGITE